MDKTIVTAFLIIAGIISAIFVFNAIYPAIQQSSDAMTSMERRMDERLQSQVQIVHATTSGSDVLVWAKNVGTKRVIGIEACDVFFGPQTNYSRIPYGTGNPHWEYLVENNTEWLPTGTLRIIIKGYSPLASGQYYVKVILPNGVSDEYFFSW